MQLMALNTHIGRYYTHAHTHIYIYICGLMVSIDELNTHHGYHFDLEVHEPRLQDLTLCGSNGAIMATRNLAVAARGR